MMALRTNDIEARIADYRGRHARGEVTTLAHDIALIDTPALLARIVDLEGNLAFLSSVLEQQAAEIARLQKRLRLLRRVSLAVKRCDMTTASMQTLNAKIEAAMDALAAPPVAEETE